MGGSEGDGEGEEESLDPRNLTGILPQSLQ